MHLRSLASSSLALVLALGACGDDGGTPQDTADATLDTAESADAVEADTTPPPWTPQTLEERGYVEVRTIIHLHSAFSHDACDEEGLDDNGTPNWTCVRRMKAALCKEHIGAAFMTDHPSYMDEQPFEDLLYAEQAEGDELLTTDGVAWGVRFACPDGQGGPDGTTTLVPGFEGTHTMPIGLRHHLTDMGHYGVSLVDGTDFDDIEAMVSDVRDAGGMVTIAHSEQDELPASMIVEHDIPLMELYNFHANFNTVLGDNFAAAMFALELFLGTDPLPRSDLTALVMLDTYPVKALNQWRAVSALRPITAFAGSDVHENVIVPAICEGGLCDDLALDYPNLVEALKKGGNLILSDSERIDAYERIFRWVQNRVLVQPGEAMPAGAEAALEAGRNVVVFEVLGDAKGASILAITGDEDDPTYHDMGSTVGVGDGATLWARSPDAPVPGSNAHWTDGSAAEMTATLYRTDAEGNTTAVHSWTEPGTWVSLPLDAAGAYQMEVTLVPHHLTPDLGEATDLSGVEFRWVETNAIRVE